MTPLSPQAIAGGVHELPALPAVVMELIRSLGNDALGAEQLAEKISRDQAIAAKTLRLANSSFYGLSRQVESIAEATTVLGLRTVRSIATVAGLVGGMPRNGPRGFDFDDFWRHATATAVCAEALAQLTRRDADGAFALGLLHDIGRLMLASSFPEAYGKVLDYREAHDCIAVDAERAVLGTDHCELGALVAEHWRFSPGMVRAIALHHAPPDQCAEADSGLLDLVHVADNIAHGLGLSRQSSDIVPALSLPAWLRLGLNEEACFRVFQQTEERHEAMCQSLMM